MGLLQMQDTMSQLMGLIQAPLEIKQWHYSQKSLELNMYIYIFDQLPWLFNKTAYFFSTPAFLLHASAIIQKITLSPSSFFYWYLRKYLLRCIYLDF